VGDTLPAFLLVAERVAPGDSRTPAERLVAQLGEDRFHQEADTSPDFARLLRRLRALGI
jgi:hypothetical protein